MVRKLFAPGAKRHGLVPSRKIPSRVPSLELLETRLVPTITVNANSGVALSPIIQGGATPLNALIGTFTDSSNLSTLINPPDYSVTINWGDGTSKTLTSTANPSNFQKESSGTFGILAPAHTYKASAVGVDNITLSVNSGTAVQTDAITVTAVTVNPNSGNPQPLSPVFAGQPTPNNALVGTFTDPSNTTTTISSSQTAAAPEYTVIIGWGDGSTTTLNSFTNKSDFKPETSGTFAILAPAHTYAASAVGVDNITLAVNTGTAVQTDTITVETVSTPPLAPLHLLSNGTFAAIPGGFQPVNGITLQGVTFTDTTGANIDAGNGGTEVYTQDPVIEGQTGGETLTMNFAVPTSILQFGVALSTQGNVTNAVSVKLYDQNGTFLKTVTANGSQPKGENFTSALFSYTPPSGISISKAEVTFNSGAASAFGLGNIVYGVPTNPVLAVTHSFTVTNVASFSNANGAEPAAAFTATINWGDGPSAFPASTLATVTNPIARSIITPDITKGIITQAANGSYVITGSHTYQAPGVYQVIVTIDETGIEWGIALLTVDVLPGRFN